MAQRHWQQLADDGVLAFGRYGWGDAFEGTLGRRAQAVETVARRLREDFYGRLKEGMRGRVWFTPLFGVAACTKNLSVQRIIYVSPIWEAAPPELVEYVVLHEMIHVALDHNLNLNGNDEHDRQINADRSGKLSGG